MSKTSITVTWPAVPGATKYAVKRNGLAVTSTVQPSVHGLQVGPADVITVTATVPTPPPPPDPTPAPATTGTGLGLLMYRGALNVCSHLTDGTYDLVIGSWGDPVLPTCSGERYAYTVLKGTPGASDPGYVVLDPANPAAYLYAANTLPAGVRLFLDNALYTAPGLFAVLQIIYPALKQQGRGLCVNAGAYIADDVRSNDGTLWQLWAKQLVAVADRIMLEHSQMVYLSATTTPAGNGEQPRVRGTGWWQQWDAYQNCPAACVDPTTGLSKYVGIAYGSIANAIYSRASTLIAPQSKGAVVIYNTGDGNTQPAQTDPYDPAWTAPAPRPTVNPVAGTATLT